MFCFLKKTLKFTVGTGALIAATAIVSYAVVGKERTDTVLHELHGSLLEHIDAKIEDPSAMRSQLREMEREYPERIAQVRGDLAELQTEIRSLERERAISERVVAMVDDDLESFEAQLASQTGPGENGLAVARAVEVDDHVYSPGRAQSRLNQMRQQRVLYANRAGDAAHDLLYLQKQGSRLEELLAKLENERAEFEGQIMGLSRQIDAIARNDRLIKLLECRNRTIEECDRYQAVSLEQVTGRLAQIKNRQEAELDLLANAQTQDDYEAMARIQIANEAIDSRHETAEPRSLELSQR